MICHHDPSPQNIKPELGFPCIEARRRSGLPNGGLSAIRVRPWRSQAAYRLVQSVFPVYRFCPPACLYWCDHFCQPAENHASAK